uniref:DUF4283 domain-containing protein n=1 Tax=Quercus lobata TaxID=97700 RepID=A0A7N2RBF7_QUELO
MGSDLRIIEVGNNILQFKFNSMFRLEWVERSGTWNFENNLFLLCRWKKGMTLTNILFSHSPFWVQVWGLPFELMSKEVGKNIGGKLGEVLKGAIEQQQLRQYGDWLRAGGTTKSGSDKAKTTSHRSWESMESEDARSKPQLGTKNIRSSIQIEKRRSGGLSDVLNLNLIGEQNSVERMDAASLVALSNLNKWDSDEKKGHGMMSKSGTVTSK